MRPSSITWTAADSSYIGTNIDPVSTSGNTSGYIPFTQNTTSTTNIYSGVTTTYIQFPTYENRALKFVVENADGLPATLTITGTNSYGQSLTEDLYFDEDEDKYSVNGYNTVTSITIVADAVEGTAWTIGTAGGWTNYYLADVYNKNSLYTIAYSDMSGTNEVTPMYMAEKVFYMVGNTQTYNTDSSTFYELPIANANFIVSPSTITTTPITANCAISFQLPLSALWTVVNNLSTGSFTQTILQQGGLV